MANPYTRRRSLNETYSYKTGRILNKKGKELKVIYIVPDATENINDHKDKLKEFGATYINAFNAWGWYLRKDPETVRREQVEPCIEYLRSVENKPEPAIDDETGEEITVEDVKSTVDQLMRRLEGEQMDEPDGDSVAPMTVDAIKNKLESFKRELVKAMTDEEFKRLFEPIFRFRNAMGSGFSLINTILIMIQDPKATMVKSRSNWLKANRTVKDGAPALAIFIPQGTRRYKKNDREALMQEFLREVGKTSENELTTGEKEKFRKRMNSVSDVRGFSLKPCQYDYRYTEQIEGTEDLVGKPSDGSIEWADDSSEATPETVKYVKAMERVIERNGIELTKVDKIGEGDARGVSMSGKIEVLKDAPENAGLVNTLVHEFSHELLHQEYLKSKNPELEAYFVGRPEGRKCVEQQAELAAWIVMKYLGYDMPTSINYIALWGANEDTAVKVFDTVAGVASDIYKWIMQEVGSGVNEAAQRPGSGPVMLTGEELADMLGAGDIYRKVESEATDSLKESFYRVYNKLRGRDFGA